MIKDYLNSRGAGIFRFTKRVILSYSGHDCPRHAAALAYYTLFSLFPLLLSLVYFTSYFFPSAESRQNLALYLEGIFPYGAENLAKILNQTWEARRSLGLISVVGLLWGGSSIFSVLETSLSRIWETKPRPYLRRRLLGILSVLAVVLVFLASTLVGPFMSLVLNGIPLGKQTISYAMQLTVVTIVAMLLYRIYPNEYVHWSAAFIGAFSAAVMIVLAKFLFRYYTIIVTARSGLLYGSLTWFLTMALWVYLVGALFLFGAEFSAAFQHRQKVLARAKKQSAKSHQ
ncbi:MAG TPA: YihY/virulence factor BrkB family protein [Anaerolineales bacterium]|nr:YihY/virulence factor BrkB family protein [Anaerolineales bacterium]